MPQLSNSFVSATQLPAAAANEAAPHVAGSAAKAWCTAALCCIGLKRPSAALEVRINPVLLSRKIPLLSFLLSVPLPFQWTMGA